MLRVVLSVSVLGIILGAAIRLADENVLDLNSFMLRFHYVG